jgi:ribosomal protein S18 acetylase RimI-like enzyme
VSRLVHLGPGHQAPDWVADVDRACFGDAWGSLDEFEHIWGFQPSAFARWRILPEVHEAELLRLGVAPEARRRGLGRALLRHCQQELEQMGVDVLHLEVRISNTGARTLYESEGWRQRGTRRAYYRDGETAILYSRGE